MAGPTTNPFQPKATIPKATPASTALAMAAWRCLATSPKARMNDIGWADVVLVIRAEPEYFTARSQYMNPTEMKSITKASWSASAQVEWVTWAGMKAMSQAARTPAPLPKWSLAMVAMGNTVSAP